MNMNTQSMGCSMDKQMNEVLDEIASMDKSDALWWSVRATLLAEQLEPKVVRSVLNNSVREPAREEWKEFVRTGGYIPPVDVKVLRGPDVEKSPDVGSLDGTKGYLFTTSNGGVFEGRPLWIDHGVLVIQRYPGGPGPGGRQTCWIPLSKITDVR